MKLFISSMAIVAMATLCLAGNPCPTFWVPFKEACYRYFGDRVTWDVANENCRNHYSDNGQANLVSIHSREENSFAYHLFRSNAGGTLAGAWIGFYQNTTGSTGPFTWTDGTSNSDFESWIPRQPDNYGDAEDCGHFWRRDDDDDTLQSWNDAPCSLDYSYICKVAQEASGVCNSCSTSFLDYSYICKVAQEAGGACNSCSTSFLLSLHWVLFIVFILHQIV